MIREHLFKGKTIEDGKWIYGDLVHSWHKMNTKPTTMIYNTLDKTEVDPTTVCEYTGLRDKNGTRIFEGDIVKWADFTMETFWGSDVGIGYGFCWKPCGSNKYYKESKTGFINEYEVIGNIFDNKELLNGN